MLNQNKSENSRIFFLPQQLSQQPSLLCSVFFIGAPRIRKFLLLRASEDSSAEDFFSLKKTFFEVLFLLRMQLWNLSKMSLTFMMPLMIRFCQSLVFDKKKKSLFVWWCNSLWDKDGREKKTFIACSSVEECIFLRQSFLENFFIFIRCWVSTVFFTKSYFLKVQTFVLVLTTF